MSTRPTPGAATGHMLGTGLLFLLVYGGTNTYTAGLERVPSLYLPWEEDIPFVPWMIFPYWSLDLFFVWSFYLLRSRGELVRHSARIALALGLSAGLFLLLPLRFALERPQVEGLPGLLFLALGADLPYNQCPSLHISLSLIYWPVVRRAVDGWARRALALWFWVIAASTLLVWQHHFIDLPGGLMVGLLVLHLLPLRTADAAPVTAHHRRVAARYLVGGIVLLVPGALFGAWAWLLLYPAASLWLVAGAYLGGREDFLAKRQGRHCAVIILLFGPYLLGARLTRWYHGARSAPWSQVADGILLGRRPTADELIRLHAQGVRTVLDLSPEVAAAPMPAGMDYRHLPMLDLVAPAPATLSEATALIEAARTRGGVYVHCNLGLGRSALAVLAWLRRTGLDAPEAMAKVKTARPLAVLPPRLLGETGRPIRGEPLHG